VLYDLSGNDDDSVALAARIHQLLRSLPCPDIPSIPGTDSIVLCSIGTALSGLSISRCRTARVAKAIRDPSGNLVIDRRDGPAPSWVSNPFPENSSDNERQTSETNFRVVRALNQRGKGGVYLAIHFVEPVPRICILKRAGGLARQRLMAVMAAGEYDEKDKLW
jgi:hypothetical protein